MGDSKASVARTQVCSAGFLRMAGCTMEVLCVVHRVCSPPPFLCLVPLGELMALRDVSGLAHGPCLCRSPRIRLGGG